MVRCKYYKKIIICGNISLVIALWADIFIAHIALNSVSTFLRQLYAGDLANIAGRTIIFFIPTLIIRLFSQMVALPPWTWLLLLLRYFFIDNHTWWYLLPSSSPPTFSASFCCNKVSPSLRYLLFLGKLYSGVSSKFLRDSMSNSYCKKDYSEGEVNVI